MEYILITSAYNEEKYIQKTIESVIKQKTLPLQWIIINDNSTDNTESIIQKYIEIPFITYIHYQNHENYISDLGKVSKRVVSCVNEALRHIKYTNYDCIGILDADTSFNENLFTVLLQKFTDNRKLGLGGGFIYNVKGNKKWSYFTKPGLVGGPLQLFRKECWDEIGGLYPGGHHDYFAVVSSKMHGWDVRSFRDLEILHLKNASVSDRSQIKTKFYLGQMDYVCGELFIYSFIRAVILIRSKPVLIGSIFRVFGYLYAFLRNVPKQVPDNLKSFLRKEQLKRIFSR